MVLRALGLPRRGPPHRDRGRARSVDRGSGASARVCFQVRSEDGEELTLVHDRGLDRWERNRERE
ncbi:MAG: hypothetical protein M5U28_49450 [Sandaracinaceae bacterium]|nr:hypothetical protein [Sandaracinaceae bacterium]